MLFATLLACDSNPVSLAGVIPEDPDPEAWYLVRYSDPSLDPPAWRFVVVPGKTALPGSGRAGSLAWACRDGETATLKARLEAGDYQTAHPGELVFGPDGKEIRSLVGE